jgi:DNA excision repair protein ERCC-2
VCIDALSVDIENSTMHATRRNVYALRQAVREVREKDAARLQEEYKSLLKGLQSELQRENDTDGARPNVTC